MIFESEYSVVATEVIEWNYPSKWKAINKSHLILNKKATGETRNVDIWSDIKIINLNTENTLTPAK